MKKYINLALVWILFIGLCIFNFIVPPSSSWVNFWTNGTIIIGWLLFAIQATYNNSNIFFLFIQRIKFHLSNKECLWNMRIYMMSNLSSEALEELDVKLREIYSTNELKVRQISETRKDYKLGAIRFEVTWDEERKQFVFDIQDMEISYRGSKIIFEEKLDVIVNELKRVFQPYNERYSVRIEFKGNNPYFGLFLKKIDPTNIDFNASFYIQDNKVSIYKKQIEINSGTYDQLKNLAKSYLALSPK
ncbi:hypothetical protein [Bacillus sp. C1]